VKHALLGSHRPESLVAFGAGGPKTAADLLADAARVARALPPPSEGSHVLLVFQEDRYAMAAALLGAFHAGHAVALPPNTRRESIFAVRERPETVAMVHDVGAGIPLRVEDVLRDAPEAPPLERATLPERPYVATVFTSGSTAEIFACRKTAGQLLGEASMLGEVFGVRPGSRVVGTVAPGHIYGLLFTVLVPLCRGAAFLRETPLHAEPIAHRVAEHAADFLVTVPLHLRALAAVDEGPLRSVGGVFSSTGPLPREVAEAFTARHGHPVTEILGATETGGIAWRARRDEGPSGARRDPRDRFRPFPGVAIDVDEEGRLLVDSPFLDPGEPRPFRTAERVMPHEDGSFTHLGRSDGVVKVGGRRVSIGEMEERLARQPGVEDAAVVAIPAAAGRGHQLLAAVVAPGGSAPALKAALLERFDPSSLPRRILFVDALPRESNGKLTRTRLLRLFGLRPDGLPINWKLAWGEPKRAIDGRVERHERSASVPEDYGWFDGHFPGYPILAGAVQLKELVLPAVASAFPELGAVRTMSRVKFTGRIVPGDRVTVVVERALGADVVDFKVAKPTEVCSAGRLAFDWPRDARAEDRVEIPS
jgi:acyl-coenzyme A synthetase/AMP-(fatty) acid ligase